MPPSVGGETRDHRLHQALRLRHQAAGRDAIKRAGRSRAWTSTTPQFLAAPFAASLILTGIHSYLGVHVVERGVIFVDLSLAQIAALGATIALLLPFTGGDPHGPWVYWISAGLHVHRSRRSSPRSARSARASPRRPSSASRYAVASAASILAMSKATSESEHLKDMLVGNILAVSWQEVLKTAVALRGRGRLPLRLPEAVPRHLDGPTIATGSDRRAPERAAAGTSSSTRPSASW